MFAEKWWKILRVWQMFRKSPKCFVQATELWFRKSGPGGAPRWTIPAPNVYNEYNENQRRRERQPAALRLCVKGATR